MHIEYLTEIVRKADKKAITMQLRELCYIDCKKDKELRSLSIETLFKGNLEETEKFTTVKTRGLIKAEYSRKSKFINSLNLLS